MMCLISQRYLAKLCSSSCAKKEAEQIFSQEQNRTKSVFILYITNNLDSYVRLLNYTNPLATEFSYAIFSQWLLIWYQSWEESSAGDLAVLSSVCTMKLLHTLMQNFWAPPLVLPQLSCFPRKLYKSSIIQGYLLCTLGPHCPHACGKPVCMGQIPSTHFQDFAEESLESSTSYEKEKLRALTIIFLSSLYFDFSHLLL